MGGCGTDLSLLHSPCLWRTWLSQCSSPTWVLQWQPLSWEGNGQDSQISKPTSSVREGLCVWSITHLVCMQSGMNIFVLVFLTTHPQSSDANDLSGCETCFLSKLSCFILLPALVHSTAWSVGKGQVTTLILVQIFVGLCCWKSGQEEGRMSHSEYFRDFQSQCLSYSPAVH